MRRLIPLLLAAVMVLSACGTKPADNSDIAPEDNNKLIICTSHQEEVYLPIIREFEHRTGIWVELISGGTNELLEQIAHGDTECDLMFGGGVDSLSAYMPIFAPYESERLGRVDEQYIGGGGAWTPFSSLPIVLIYNTKLVRLNPPTGWADLTNSAWRGRIAFADPSVSGSS